VKTWFNQPARKKQRAMARAAKATATFPRPLQKLRPLVHSCTRKYNSKVRYGRGFSLAELKKAKLSPAFARSVGISVDSRRHDTSEETLQLNVQRLESYKSKLILFPRREEKYKKGEIPDSTADKLKSAEAEKQNKSKHLLEAPKRKLREKMMKITPEMKAFKAYRKLRLEQTNKKWKGRREKRAKEEAEKKK